MSSNRLAGEDFKKAISYVQPFSVELFIAPGVDHEAMNVLGPPLHRAFQLAGEDFTENTQLFSAIFRRAQNKSTAMDGAAEEYQPLNL